MHHLFKNYIAIPLLLIALIAISLSTAFATAPQKRFHVLVLAENGGHHILFTKAAKPWLNKLAADNNFTVDYIENTDKIDATFLSRYQLFIQLDYPPYGWTNKAVTAFEDYITTGKGGWIGLHHATLLGEFDGYPIWQWFADFMGGIRFTNYIASFVAGRVKVEAPDHPCMKGVPPSFVIEKEEWYTYNSNPRSNVQVIASVDESSYTPASEIKMGDHPVIWTNPHFTARNLYIFMGHSPELFRNEAYTTLFKNAILWAAQKN
jgi:type 1 glutamine amidotransferase